MEESDSFLRPAIPDQSKKKKFPQSPLSIKKYSPQYMVCRSLIFVDTFNKSYKQEPINIDIFQNFQSEKYYLQN